MECGKGTPVVPVPGVRVAQSTGAGVMQSHRVPRLPLREQVSLCAEYTFLQMLPCTSRAAVPKPGHTSIETLPPLPGSMSASLGCWLPTCILSPSHKRSSFQKEGTRTYTVPGGDRGGRHI